MKCFKGKAMNRKYANLDLYRFVEGGRLLANFVGEEVHVEARLDEVSDTGWPVYTTKFAFNDRLLGIGEIRNKVVGFRLHFASGIVIDIDIPKSRIVVRNGALCNSVYPVSKVRIKGSRQTTNMRLFEPERETSKTKAL